MRQETTTGAIHRDDADDVGERASLVHHDLPHRLQRRVGLIPARGFGTGRRVLFYALLTWLPIAVWAVVTGAGAAAEEPLLHHFGVHIRCLVAIPLFIIAEPLLHDRIRTLLPHLLHAGIVRLEDAPRFHAIVAGVIQLRDASLPWITILALALGWTILGRLDPPHDVLFARAVPEGLSFGGWWFLLVSRPLYLVFTLGWLWRIGLVATLFRRIAALPLAIVPTHPDRVGGLAFLERVTAAFAPVALALSAVVAAGWAHDELYHGVAVTTLRAPMGVLLVLLVALGLAPLLMFTPPLATAKRQALLDYGALVARHGRLVRRRWIEGEETVDDGGLLAAPELGPVADTVALYEGVERMRALLPGRMAIAPVLLAALVPIVAALSLQIPVKDVVLKVLRAVL